MQKRNALLHLAVLTAGLFGFLPLSPASAQEFGTDDVQLYLDAQTISRGYTVRKPSGDFLIGVFPNVLDRVATVRIHDVPADGTGVMDGWTRVSDVFEFDILTDPIKTFGKEVIFQVKYTSDTFKTKRLFFWDGNWQQWRPLRSVNILNDKMVRAFTHLPYSKVAVFEEDRTREGLASWYRDSRTYTASSNDFPVGSTVKVINVETGAFTIVKIVSTGPFVDGRVIDLERTAFSTIASTSAGIVKVVVEPADAAIGTSSRPASGNPGITAAAGIVWDPIAQRVLYDKNIDAVRPLASITKLMTAIVFVETNPNWDTVVTIAAEDRPQPIVGTAIAVEAGDTITVRDLFEAMLTGSANNAAYALSRSTGLTREEFVARMNKRASGLGMTNTRFIEPSGLSTENVSTARDIAKLVAYASNRLGLAQATISPTDSYTKLLTGEVRTIRNPLYMSEGFAGKPLLLGKTGYLDEALYTLGIKARNANGDQRVIVVLGSTSKAARNSDAVRLLDWSLP